MTRRPAGVAVAALVLVVAGAVSVVAGLLAASLGGCCGGTGDADPLPAVLGLGAGCTSAAAGAILWRGGTTRWPVLALAAGIPLVCLAASAGSADLASVAPVAVAGWLLLAWFVSRRPVAAWLARRRDG